MIDTEKLEKTGFKRVSTKIKNAKELHRKISIAYEHFRYVKQEKIDAFNERLKQETLKEDKSAYYYRTLRFIPIENYDDAPPLNVLNKIEQAQELGCFDTFEIAKIQDRIEVKDPIVFGRINDCPDRFFIAQWDDDVKIENILKENEG